LKIEKELSNGEYNNNIESELVGSQISNEGYL
jgi:hypothetical protein